MITKLTHGTVFVHDQNEALAFYQKLGFGVHTDVTFDGFRWLTLNLPEQPEVEVALLPALNEEEKALVGKQCAKKPLLSLESSDCQKDYDRLSELGITFVEKPAEQPWGISAMMTDLYGNLLYLCQPIQH